MLLVLYDRLQDRYIKSLVKKQLAADPSPSYVRIIVVIIAKIIKAILK